MKKITVLAMSGMLLLSSCGSYTATGAYTGSNIGAILGSAIGGISNGPRGSDWGQIIGMAGGAAVGAAVGNAAEKAQQRKIERYHERVLGTGSQGSAAYQQGTESGFDPQNSGDDRFEFQPSGSQQAGTATTTDGSGRRHLVGSGAGTVTVSNVQFIDGDRDHVLSAGEQARIVFEIRNNSQQTVYGVQPSVTETTGNRQVMVSPGIEVESIAPGSGIRYTAQVVAGKRLKKGQVGFEIAVAHDGKAGTEVKHLTVETRR